MAAFAAAEMMPFDNACEPAAFTDADDIHFVVRLELIHQHLVAGLQIAAALRERELPKKTGAGAAGLLQVARLRLIDAPFLDVLHQAQLHRIIALGDGRLALHHHARTGLEQRDRHRLAVCAEHLRHSNFLAKDSWCHLLNPYLPRRR